MKKLTLKKFRKKQEAPSRITNETVAEHRERILAGGRRFKYPMQYARHKLVINAIIIVLVTILALVLIGWWQLYPVQNTSTFFYRVTRVLPLPVAVVDGEQVRYSDYLLHFNSSAHYLQQSEQVDLNSDDGKRQLDYIKRKTMDNVVADAYAAKIAREQKITISDSDVDAIIKLGRTTTNGVISQETYDASALSILGWTPDENREVIRSGLIRNAVSYQIDTVAKDNVQKVTNLLQNKDIDFDLVAKTVGGSGDSAVTAGVSGLVPNFNNDGGLSAAADKLQKGQLSPVIKSTTGDGYYVVRLLEKTDTKISYAFIKIPLTVFNAKLADLKKNNKVTEYISIPQINDQAAVKSKE
ncbi:MAG: peptidylprolyl isomerase [Candidatus Saccharimonadales bacterium]